MGHGIDKKRDKIKNLFFLSDWTIFCRNWTNALVFPWVLYSIFSSNLTVLKTMTYAQFNEFFWFIYLFDVIFSLNLIKEESLLYESWWLWSKYIRLGLGHFQNLMLAGWVDYFYYKIQRFVIMFNSMELRPWSRHLEKTYLILKKVEDLVIPIWMLLCYLEVANSLH